MIHLETCSQHFSNEIVFNLDLKDQTRIISVFIEVTAILTVFSCVSRNFCRSEFLNVRSFCISKDALCYLSCSTGYMMGVSQILPPNVISSLSIIVHFINTRVALNLSCFFEFSSKIILFHQVFLPISCLKINSGLYILTPLQSFGLEPGSTGLDGQDAFGDQGRRVCYQT